MTDAQTPTPAAADASTGAGSTAHTQPARGTIRNTKIGRVVSTKMQKTIVVAVEELTRHRLYRKTMRRTTRFKAHDEWEKAGEGDLVRIVESRPMSKEKHYRLETILEKREAPIDVVKEVREE